MSSETKSHFLNPDRAKDFLTQADLHAKSRNYQEAIQAIRECLKYQPNNVEAHLLAVKIYLKAGKFETANDLIDDLHRHAAPSTESLLLKARAALGKGEYKICEDALEDVFAKRRDNPEALAIMADLFYRKERYADAASIYERLFLKDHGNKDLLYSLATTYFQMKDFNETLFFCSQLMNTGKVPRAVTELYERALKEKKKEFVKAKGHVSFLDKVRLMIHDPFTTDQIKIHSEKERETQRANRQTYVDANTGALNFKAMKEYVPTHIIHAKGTLFLCQLDVDFFKAFNEYYSHQVGDVVLRVLAQMGGVGFPQRFFRKGGEEFVWTYDGTESDAIEKAVQFRERVEKYAISESNNMIVNIDLIDKTKGEHYKLDRGITITQGLCKYEQSGRTLDELLEAADKNLKMGKETGRNAVVYQGKVINQGQKPVKPVLDGRP